VKPFLVGLYAATVTFATVPANAYFNSDVLNTINNVSITANYPDVDSRDCGVREYSPYKIALREELEEIGVSYEADSEIDAYLEIAMLKVEQQDLCFITVILSFEYDLSTKFERVDSEHWVKIYSDYVIGYASVLEVEAYTTELVVEAVKSFDSWR
jgi:hypothetical protein